MGKNTKYLTSNKWAHINWTFLGISGTCRSMHIHKLHNRLFPSTSQPGQLHMLHSYPLAISTDNYVTIRWCISSQSKYFCLCNKSTTW